MIVWRPYLAQCGCCLSNFCRCRSCFSPSTLPIGRATSPFLQVVREQKLREKEAKEAELRDLAVRARMERAGAAAPAAPVPMAARGEG